MVVSVVAKLLRGDEISKLLDDRGKKVNGGAKEEETKGASVSRGGEWVREGRGFDNCNSLPCQGISSVAVVVVDEQEKQGGPGKREGYVRFDTFLKFTTNFETRPPLLSPPSLLSS